MEKTFDFLKNRTQVNFVSTIIGDYTYEEARTALTKIIRADRFVSGELYACVKEGILAEVLGKILELQDAE